MQFVEPKFASLSKLVIPVQVEDHVLENFFDGPFDVPVTAEDVLRLVGMLNAAAFAYRADNNPDTARIRKAQTFEFDGMRLRYEIDAARDPLLNTLVFSIFQNDD